MQSFIWFGRFKQPTKWKKENQERDQPNPRKHGVNKK
jgi:hypothetical protein